MAMVCSPNTLNEPGGSPRGVTSWLPSASAVATQQNGDISMQRRRCWSMRPMSLTAASELTLP
jgi:hypothetical protein